MAEAIAIDHRFFTRYRWGMVDASMRDELADAWQSHVIAPTFLGEDTGRCPVLLDLQRLPDNDRFALIDRLAANPDALFCLLLESERSLEQLIIHLRERLVFRDVGDDPPRQFRYYDPGTFLQLPALLGDAGMRWLLGPVTAVAIPWCGEWRRYPRPEGTGMPTFKLRDHLPELLRLSVVNRVLLRLHINSQEDWCNKAIITGQHIARAEQHGLSVRDDLVAFACHAWQHHEGFDKHPRIRQLLKQLADSTPEDELDYRELSARLDEADWQMISRELTEPLPGQLI